MFLKKTLALASKGRTSPNPKVGCIIVKNNKIIASGYHEKAGMPHAEINALNKAGRNAKGATMYVSLEPCCITGKTPPCTKAIIKSGIKKVVIAMVDPNPDVNGKGIQELEKNKIKVELQEITEAKKLNEAYTKYMVKKLPFVLIKVGMSLDGKIATSSGDSKYITNEKSLHYVHELRSQYDAIMVSANTVINENPSLTCRIEDSHDPVRIVVDSKLRIPLTAAVLKDSNFIICTTRHASPKKISQLRDYGGHVLVIKDNNGLVELTKMMQELATLGITSIILECGSQLNAAAINCNLVDKVMFFIAPKLLGGNKIPIGDIKVDKLKDALTLTNIKIRQFGNNVLIEGSIS